MSIPIKKEIPRALLVSVQTPEVTDEENASSLLELERLVSTLGFTVIGKQTQRQKSTSGPTAVGAGKLQELATLTITNAETETPVEELATVVVFDCELRPSQLHHLEGGLGVEVLDRSGVIIEIFSRHANTRVARLQVEIARLNYLSPRIRETGSSGERQAGRGSGESALETERRSIRDQLAELRRELAALQKNQTEHRSARSELNSVALVGYTNAGKSSTMRALTGSEVLVEDKLFATLDTTVRSLKPESYPRILISDTVGFIKKLPHDLVASFRSTLEEALNASLLLYVVDAADPTFRTQLEVVDVALRDVGIKNTPALLVLNKADQLDEHQKKLLSREFPDAILMSTRSKEAVRALHDRILGFFEKEMKDEEILVPYTAEGAIGEIRASMRVLKQSFEEAGTRFLLRAREEQLQKLKTRFGLLGILLFLSTSAYAALDCPSLKAKLEVLNVAKKDWKEIEIPATELSSYLEALPSPHAPSGAELKARLKSIHSNPEAKFPRYLEDNYANCTMRRAELRVALLKTAATKPLRHKDRKRIAHAVLNTVKSEKKFPTLISALADARVLEFGVEQKVWKASTKELNAIRALHQKIKDELAEENKTYGTPWSEVSSGLQKLDKDSEKEKFLRESESFKKVRAHILAEPEESGRHLRELRKTAKKLSISSKRLF